MPEIFFPNVNNDTSESKFQHANQWNNDTLESKFQHPKPMKQEIDRRPGYEQIMENIIASVPH